MDAARRIIGAEGTEADNPRRGRDPGRTGWGVESYWKGFKKSSGKGKEG